MKLHTAIVLKKQKNKQRLALLSPLLGRVDAIYNEPILLSSGSHISYTVSRTNEIIFIKNIDLVDLPLFLATEDLLFLHHVLELVAYLVPIGAIELQLFEICCFLYKQQTLSTLEKKMFLCVIFIAAGFPPPDNHKKIRLSRINPIDMIRRESLHLADEQTLNVWLKACINEHPNIDGFKTRQFLSTHNII